MAMDSNYTFGGDHFVVDTDVELRYTPETYIMILKDSTFLKGQKIGQ